MKTIIAAALALLVALPVVAQDFRKGFAAAKRGDYATALKEWRPLAEQGSTAAQYNLGQMYRQGEGVSKNYKEAAKWFRKAAEQGRARAQSTLGVMYARGLGVPQDYAKAVTWYRKAAEQEHASAQHKLGIQYHKGLGVRQSYTQAHMWYSLAAEQGHKKAKRDRNNVVSLMTRAKIAEAQKLAQEWRAKHRKKK